MTVTQNSMKGPKRLWFLQYTSVIGAYSKPQFNLVENNEDSEI